MKFFQKKYGTTLLLAIIFLCLSGTLTAQNTPGNQLKEGSEVHYKVTSDNVIIGYSVYKISQKMSLAGESFVKFQSLSVLRAGMGYIQESVFQSDFSISAQKLTPSYYMLRQTSGNQEALSETVFSKGLIAQKNAIGNNQESSLINTDNDCYLFMNNLWGRMDSMIEHYMLLILASNNQKESVLNVYDPILKTEGKVKLVKERETVIKILNKDLKCLQYTMYDFYNIPLLKIWYDAKSNRIAKMEEIGGSLVFELSTVKAAEELKKSNGIDLWQKKTALSPIYFQDKSKIDILSVTGNFTGRGFAPPEHSIIGFSQSFNGEIKENSLNGTFVAKKTPLTVDKPNRFPPFKLDESIKPYLQPQTGIDSSNDYIVNKAQEITWKSRDSMVAASKICKWIKDNVKSGVSMPSSLLAFLSGIANPESRAMLMTAMCRAAGLPARMAGGIVFDKGDFVPGYWTEVYIENNGWVPFDTDKGEEGIDAAHIYLWEFGDLTSLSIENVDFTPKPPKKVAFHQKDISWPVGEERIFQIKKGDTVIGKEKAVVEDMHFGENGEVYKFKVESSLKIGDALFTAVSTTELTPYALPVSFISNSGIGSQQQQQQFRFTDKYIENIVPAAGEGEIIRNIPYSQGTYLLDQRYLSLWALVIGQIPRVELGKKYEFTVFIPESMKTMDIELEVKNFERVEAEGRDFNAFKCETQNGLIFYIDPSGRVVKVNIPAQELEFVLASPGEEMELPQGDNEKNAEENITESMPEKTDAGTEKKETVTETENTDSTKPAETVSPVKSEKPDNAVKSMKQDKNSKTVEKKKK